MSFAGAHRNKLSSRGTTDATSTSHEGHIDFCRDRAWLAGPIPVRSALFQYCRRLLSSFTFASGLYLVWGGALEMIDASTSISTFKAGHCRTISRKSRSWERIQADHVRRTGLAKEETSLVSNRHLVLLNLKGNAERGDYALDGKSASFVPRRPGSVLFIPANCHWTGWEVGASSGAYLSISVEPSLVDELLGRRAINQNVCFSPVLGCEDPVLMSAARGIGAEISDRSPLGALVAESYVATIFAQLLRTQQFVPDVRKTGGLSPASLSRVIEKIDEDLETELSLAQLADIAGLSIPHFCRAFKQTTGAPPYAFIVQRRIERAKEYLRHSSMPITDVALICGFSSSSHLANAFRREVGMAPSTYRAL